MVPGNIGLTETDKIRRKPKIFNGFQRNDKQTLSLERGKRRAHVENTSGH